MATPRRERFDRVPFVAVLVVAFLALAPTWFAARLPAETNWIEHTAPWATRIGDTLRDDEGGDSFLAYLPDRLEAIRQWRAGRLPLWNPRVGCGQPLLGSQLANPLDPTILFHLVLPLPYAMALTCFLGLAIAGCGLVLLLRQQGLRRPGPLAIGGISFALNAYFVNWLELRVFVAGLATLPLALWALEEMHAGRQAPRRAGALAIAVGLALLGGTLQTSFLFLSLVALRLVALVLEGRTGAPVDPARTSRRKVAWIGAALMAGLALGSLALVSALETFTQSVRAQGGAGYYAGSNALNWRALSLWFNPGAFGWPREGRFALEGLLGRTMGGGSGWGSAGLIPLGLALLALLRGAGPRRVRLLWGGLAGATLLFLLAQPLGVNAFLGRAWPGLNDVDLLRGLIVANLGLAILAAWGAEALFELMEDRTRWKSWVLPLAIFAVAGSLLIALARKGVTAPPHPLLLDILPVLVTALLVLMLGVSFEGTPRATAWRSSLVVGLVAVQLLHTHFRFNGFSGRDTAYPMRPVLEGLARAQGAPDFSRLVIPGRFRLLTPNLATAVGLDEIRSYTNMPPARLRLMLDCAEGHRSRNKTLIDRPRSPIYRLLGGGLLFTFWPPPEPDSLFERVPLPGGVLFRRRDALPRAFLVHRVESLADEAAARERLGRPDFDPARLAYLEASSGPLPGLGEPAGAERVTIMSLDADRHVLEVVATAPALLVTADAWYPGWRATLDGAPARLLPANWGVRGVVVPAGVHRVEMTYRPAWLVPGGVLMALGLVAALASLFGGFGGFGGLGRRSGRGETDAAGGPGGRGGPGGTGVTRGRGEPSRRSRNTRDGAR